ncbi:hypothetical protein PLICRDRAFT_26569 [Plicaturopsis crispa FD-325 SS-3]|nr:hypothetical protein PLICRDRAFT_26569 [Plicaturopsis crispa FD-325 SS-3]
MPRPSPLRNLTTARPYTSDYQSLTPRTPHSRAGLAEEALDEVALEPLGDDDYRTYRQQQAEPLLASSASESFPPSGYRNRGDDHDMFGGEKSRLSLQLVLSRLPVVMGGILACILLGMTIVSLKRPDVLEHYIGYGTVVEQDAATPPQEQSLEPLDPSIISYANYTQFPLLPTEYKAECDKIMHGFMHHGAYWDKPLHGPQDVLHHDPKDWTLFEHENINVCKSTITYMLDGHVGLLADLALMSQAASLARQQNRTFFVDDTYWNRGRWTDHFQDVRSRQPGPERGCRAPPPEELVACPRTARHWVVNSRTAKFHFGHPFSEEFEDPYKIGLNRLRPMYNGAYDSFTETIRPNAETAALIRSARDEFAAAYGEIPYISVHLRRGDRKAQSWKYWGKHVPIPDYVDALEDTFRRLLADKGSRSMIYVASDSPPAQSDFIASLPSSTSVYSLAASNKSDLNDLASPREYVQADFDLLKEDERIKLTRGMIVDFAMLSGFWAWPGDVTPVATICTITSSVCRISAVGLGWETAFGHVKDSGEVDEEGKGWVEIDNRDTVQPVWQPFELFN